MGHAISYCAGCSTQLREPDFEKGNAFQAGGYVYCKACCPEHLRTKAPSPPERKPELLSPGTSRIMHVPAPPPSGSLKPATILLIAGAAVALLAAAFLLVGGNARPASQTPIARPEPPSSTPSPPPPTPAPAPAPVDERPAQDALRRAREFAQSRPDDLAGQLALFDAAVFASDGTGHRAAAVRERDAVLNRLKPEVKSGLEALDGAARAAAADDEYGKGLRLFEEAAARPLGADWAAEVSRRSHQYQQTLDAVFASVKAEAVAARQRGADADINRIADRVAKWGIDRYRSELAKAVAPSAPKPKPPAPAVAKDVETYRRRWSEAIAAAPKRDYAAVMKKLEEAKAGLADPAVPAELAADLESVKQAMAVHDEGLQALLRTAKGAKLTVTYVGETGALLEVSGTVTRLENHEIDLAREKGPVRIPVGEVAARSLAALARPKRDGPGLALLCLLERDLEGARSLVESDGGIAEKYWALATKPPKEPAEAEARRLFWIAERELSTPSRAVAGAQRYAALLKEKGETAFVRRNGALIAARAEVPKELFFGVEDIRASAGFRPYRGEKEELFWKCVAEMDPAKPTDVYAEIAFSALPDVEYRCWFYVGGCCTETIACSFQATEGAEPGGETATPVKSLPSMQYKTHASHTGRGRPTPRFGWVAVTLPKFSAGGVKKVRIVPSEKGFCVAEALVSAAKPGAPTAAETNQLEKMRTDQRAAVRPDPGLVAHWKLYDGGGAVAADSSPTGLEGKLMNNAGWAPPTATPWGPPALKLEAKSYVSLGNQIPLLQNVQGATLAAWICPDKFSGDGSTVIAISRNNGATPTQDSRASLLLSKDGLPQSGGRAPDSSSAQTLTATPKLKPGVWVHLASTIDYTSDSITIYVNGVAQTTTGTVKFGAKSTPNTPSTCGAIGADDDGSKSYFLGRLADVRIYNRPLTAEEVAELAAPFQTPR